mmetsp:Transcript_46692/g.91190  ORF Transcript_46692/g.91190 Transcript_46692/m.91190 type:complete len:115 (-) Transcript_46692:12-356(-)
MGTPRKVAKDMYTSRGVEEDISTLVVATEDMRPSRKDARSMWMPRGLKRPWGYPEVQERHKNIRRGHRRYALAKGGYGSHGDALWGHKDHEHAQGAWERQEQVVVTHGHPCHNL